MHGYQHRGADFIVDTPYCALWADMGLGKTVMSLTALARLFSLFEIGRALVVSRKRVVRDTWPTEAARWSQSRHLRVYNLNGAIRRERVELPDGKIRFVYHVDRDQLLVDADIYLISQEYIPHIVTAWGQHWPYDTVLLDDVKGLKRASSVYYRKLRSIRSRTQRIIELTGTPAPNGLLQIWPQMFLLDGGKRLGKTFTGYQKMFFEPDYNGYDWTPRPGAEKEIHARVSDICLSMSGEDHLDLGEDAVFNDITIPLPGKLKDQYRELEKEFLLALDSGDEVSADTAAILSNKLQQFCNGSIYTEAPEWRAVHALKLDVLEEILDEANGNPILLAYNFIPDKIRIHERFGKRAVRIDAPNFQARWDAGEIPLAVTHPDSAGHGLNLQRGGHIAAWFGLNWSLELYAQFNERIGRTRQVQSRTGKVPIYHRILIDESIDLTIRDTLAGKYVTQSALLHAVKRDIRRRIS